MNKNISLLKELEVKNTEIEELKWEVDDLERNLQSFKEKIGSINSLLNDFKD
jgi:predicted  nucleic acid-binding Zn-ribbon protein